MGGFVRSVHAACDWNEFADESSEIEGVGVGAEGEGLEEEFRGG